MKNNHVSPILIFFISLTDKEQKKWIVEFNFDFVGTSDDNQENI